MDDPICADKNSVLQEEPAESAEIAKNYKTNANVRKPEPYPIEVRSHPEQPKSVVGSFMQTRGADVLASGSLSNLGQDTLKECEQDPNFDSLYSSNNNFQTSQSQARVPAPRPPTAVEEDRLSGTRHLSDRSRKRREVESLTDQEAKSSSSRGKRSLIAKSIHDQDTMDNKSTTKSQFSSRQSNVGSNRGPMTQFKAHALAVAKKTKAARLQAQGEKSSSSNAKHLSPLGKPSLQKVDSNAAEYATPASQSANQRRQKATLPNKFAQITTPKGAMPKVLDMGNISNNEDDPLNLMDDDRLPAIESRENLGEDDSVERQNSIKKAAALLKNQQNQIFRGPDSADLNNVTQTLKPPSMLKVDSTENYTEPEGTEFDSGLPYTINGSKKPRRELPVKLKSINLMDALNSSIDLNQSQQSSAHYGAEEIVQPLRAKRASKVRLTDEYADDGAEKFKNMSKVSKNSAHSRVFISNSPNQKEFLSPQEDESDEDKRHQVTKRLIRDIQKTDTGVLTQSETSSVEAEGVRRAPVRRFVHPYAQKHQPHDSIRHRLFETIEQVYFLLLDLIEGIFSMIFNTFFGIFKGMFTR